MRVSVSSSGNQANTDSWSPPISADGRYVAFDSDDTNLVAVDTNPRSDVFVHERAMDATPPPRIPTSPPPLGNSRDLPPRSASQPSIRW